MRCKCVTRSRRKSPPHATVVSNDFPIVRAKAVRHCVHKREGRRGVSTAPEQRRDTTAVYRREAEEHLSVGYRYSLGSRVLWQVNPSWRIRPVKRRNLSILGSPASSASLFTLKSEFHTLEFLNRFLSIPAFTL